LTEPVPVIEFADRSSCFTGIFDFGQRRKCAGAVEERGAQVSNSVSKELDYLVVGSIGSENWLHATFGTKIRKAVEYRDGGCRLVLVDELTAYAASKSTEVSEGSLSRALRQLRAAKPATHCPKCGGAVR
jgi:hypothetical protein